MLCAPKVFSFGLLFSTLDNPQDNFYFKCVECQQFSRLMIPLLHIQLYYEGEGMKTSHLKTNHIKL